MTHRGSDIPSSCVLCCLGCKPVLGPDPTQEEGDTLRCEHRMQQTLGCLRVCRHREKDSSSKNLRQVTTLPFKVAPSPLPEGRFGLSALALLDIPASRWPRPRSRLCRNALPGRSASRMSAPRTALCGCLCLKLCRRMHVYSPALFRGTSLHPCAPVSPRCVSWLALMA